MVSSHHKCTLASTHSAHEKERGGSEKTCEREKNNIKKTHSVAVKLEIRILLYFCGFFITCIAILYNPFRLCLHQARFISLEALKKHFLWFEQSRAWNYFCRNWRAFSSTLLNFIIRPRPHFELIETAFTIKVEEHENQCNYWIEWKKDRKKEKKFQRILWLYPLAQLWCSRRF